MTIFVNNGVKAADGAVPVYQIVDGGTGQITAGAALTALGGINAADHNGIDHTVGPLNLLNQAAHDALDHASIPGVDAQTDSVQTGAGISKSRTIPAGTLAQTNDRLEFKAWGVTGGAGGSVQVTFDGSAILSFGVSNSISWMLQGTIIRVGASAQEVHVIGSSQGGGPNHLRSPTTKIMSAALPLIVTAPDGDVFALVISKWSA